MDAVEEFAAPIGDTRRSLKRWWLASMLVVTAPFLGLMAGRESAIYGDLQHYHLPLFQWVWRTLGAGHSPWWSGWAFAGQNVAGIGQGAIWYPPNALFGLFGTVTAYRWWLILHLWLATSGAFMWTWRRWGSAPGAAVAAVVYGLNGALILHLVHANFTIASAWLPWLFLGLDGIVRGGGLRRWLAYVVPLVLIAFAGHPQMLWASLVGTGIVVVVELSRRSAGWLPWARYAAATSLALGISTVHLLPQLLFSRTSERPSLSENQTLSDSARLSDLFTAIFPHIEGGGARVPGLSAWWLGNLSYHEVGNHIGMAAALLAMVAVIARRTDRRTISMAVLAVVAVLMALGNHTPFAGIVYDTVPLADRFRLWPRYLVLANLAVSCLAAAGTATLLEAPRRWRTPVAIGGVAVIVAAPVIVAFGDSLVSGGTLVVAILVPAVSFLALLAVTQFGERHRAGAAIALVAACAFPALVFTMAAPWRSEALSPSEARRFFDPASATWAPFDAPGGIDRWVSRFATDRGTAIVRDTSRVDGYDPLIQKDFATTTGATYVGGVSDDRLWSRGWRADVLRITTLAAPPETVPPDPAWTITSERTEDGISLWERTPRLPDAYVVGAVVLDSFDSIDRRLSDDDADFPDTVYLEADSVAAAQVAVGRNTPGTAGTIASGSMNQHGHGAFVATTDRPSVLVISSPWLDGWTATVNGREVPVARANSVVLAVPLEAGRNEVTLDFTPPGLRVGAAVSLLSLLLLAAVGVGPAARRRLAGRG